MIPSLLRQEHERGRGIFLITHDMSTAAQADTVYQLTDGELVAATADGEGVDVSTPQGG